MPRVLDGAAIAAAIKDETTSPFRKPAAALVTVVCTTRRGMASPWIATWCGACASSLSEGH